ncbi:MAG: restriction endonuclease subunit S [Pseudomonadota bacterium]
MLSDWRFPVLSDVATFISGGTPNKATSEFWGGDIPWVTVSDMKSLRLTDAQYKLTPAGAAQVRIVEKGTILVLVRGMGLFKDLPILLCEDPLTFNQDIKGLIPDSDIDSEYLAYALIARKSEILRHVDSAGHGTGRLDTDLLKSTPVPIPPLHEQWRIAEILRTWDEAIEKLEALRAAKELQRKGILQNLLGIDRTFPSHWEVKPLHKIAERIRRTNDGGDHPVMTISAKSGFLMQADKFARNMAGTSVDRYTLLHEGEFAYNKGNSKTAPYGCIYPLDRPSAVIPFVYFCFKLDESLHHAFYVHLFAAGALHHQLSRLINSGVRNDGLLNLYADDFFNCEVPVPSLEEQKQIAKAITAANEEIALLDSEITAVQRQKRGLMQKLLTGEWRVSFEDTAEAEK